MNKRFHVALWAAQIVLAVVFAMVGASKTFLAPAELFRMLPDVAAFPLPLVRFIGIAELAAAAGLILPALTRIAPLLTPLAATGVVIVMLGAFAFHAQAGHFAKLPLVIVLGILAGFVAWARFTRARVVQRELQAV